MKRDEKLAELRAIVAAIPISSCVGLVVNGRKIRNFNEAKNLLEKALKD